MTRAIPTPTTSRRGLLTGASLSVGAALSSCILPTPAPAGELAADTTPHPDARLLAALERATEIFAASEAARSDGLFAMWAARYCREFYALNEEIEATPSTTIEGARAKAAYALLEVRVPKHCRAAYAALAELLAMGHAR